MSPFHNCKRNQHCGRRLLTRARRADRRSRPRRPPPLACRGARTSRGPGRLPRRTGCSRRARTGCPTTWPGEVDDEVGPTRAAGDDPEVQRVPLAAVPGREDEFLTGCDGRDRLDVGMPPIVTVPRRFGERAVGVEPEAAWRAHGSRRGLCELRELLAGREPDPEQPASPSRASTSGAWPRSATYVVSR